MSQSNPTSRKPPKYKPGSKEVRAFISEEAHVNGTRTAKALGVTMTILVERIFLRDDLKQLYLETIPE